MISVNSTDTRVYRTEPETKLYPWKRTPSKIEQALEAANDDPTMQEFVNMLCSLDGISVLVDGDDEDWRPTEVMVEIHDKTMQCDRATRDLLTIARRAGWKVHSVSFGVRKRLTFVPTDEVKA